MIAKMKKVSLVVMQKNRTESLEKLRELGLIHLEKKEGDSEKLRELLERKHSIDVAMGILYTFAPKKRGTSSHNHATRLPDNLADAANSLFERRKETQELIASNNREITRIEKWGNFAPEDIHRIVAAGIPFNLYELSYKQDFQTMDKNQLLVLGRKDDTVFCVAVGEPLANKTPFVLPEKSLADLKIIDTRLRLELAGIEEKFVGWAHFAGSLKEEMADLLEEIEFETAQAGMDKDEEFEDARTIAWITGYVPASELGVIKRASVEYGWALYATDPEEEDRPPTLLKNNPFVRIIKPLFDFMGTIPGYREYDISPSYLLFFCIFFAMIFGDGAYGSILFLLIAIIGISFKAKTGKVPDVLKLFGLLSLCTIGWGAITGSWFAIAYEDLPPVLQALVIPPFNEAVPLREFPPYIREIIKLPDAQPVNTAHWNIQFLCFTIAVVQLVYSHIKNIKRLLPSAVAVAQLGWLVMMIGLYFLVLSMLLKIELPPFAIYFITIGLGTYFLFACQNGGNVLVNVGKSFANFLPTALNAVSSFADIISYIRLFAVGLAGASIARSFNTMGGDIAAGSAEGAIAGIVIKTAIAILILVFGHSLNMAMNALAVIVHGVRLNLLEYAGNHLGMEWSGYPYKPFAITRKKNN